jgi:hypothetical protein
VIFPFKARNYRIEGARCVMRMIINSRSGLAARLCICLGLVLILFFIACVAPAGAIMKENPCTQICQPCVKDPDTEKCKNDQVCLPIGRVLYGGKWTIVYAWFKQECCTFERATLCQPQTRCKNTGGCEIDGDPREVACKGTSKSCGDWQMVPGSLGYGRCAK